MSEDGLSSHTGIEWNGTTGIAQYGSDKNMLVFFYTRPHHNVAKSTVAGRPVYEDTVFVKIQAPGERLNIIERPATVDDQRRFAMQWNQFKENRTQVPDGTPIDMLYPDQPSIGANLRASGVHTIEQCGDLSANAIESIGMGAQRYVNDARKYLEMSNKGVGASQLRRELDERDTKIHALEYQIKLMGEQMDALQKNSTGGGSTPSFEQFQAFMASQQGRPTFPEVKTQAPTFDAQQAMINDTHPTRDVKRPKAKAKEVKASPARQRVRIS